MKSLRARLILVPAARVRREGAALLLVLWAIAFLMFILVATFGLVGDNAMVASTARAEVEAWLQARSGLAVASRPDLEPWDLLLRNDPSLPAGYEVAVLSEAGKPDLNFMLTGRNEQAGHRFLAELFQIWGLSEGEAEVLVERMADYVDVDDATRLNGAESDAYADLGRESAPPNRPFTLPEEARGVIGAALLDAVRPGWPSEFTTFVGGPIDLAAANAEVIAAATGLSPSAVVDFVAGRDGEDGMAHTEDDMVPESLEEALARLSVDTGLVPLAVDGDVVRIESFGWAGDAGVRIVEVRRQGSLGDSGLLYYREGK
jgi:type II secretory pathway component PulK